MPDLQEPPKIFLGQPRQDVSHESWAYWFLRSDLLCDPDEGDPADIWVRFSFLRGAPVRHYLVHFRCQGEGSSDEVGSYDAAMHILHEDYAQRVRAALKMRLELVQRTALALNDEASQLCRTLNACTGPVVASLEDAPTLWERLQDSDPV